MKKKETWLKYRHRVVTAVLRPFFKAYCKFKYHIDMVPFKEQGDRQYLVLMNHQTGFDQFFIAASFKGPIYYIATEDIFSLGFLSRALSWLVAPIPIKKQTMDIQAVKNCLKVAKEGGTIALAPEGNRTYSGKTEYIKPGIISLI
ncbi:MAG: 1-acyl-sn-glycerol-3-phosphate acyltransferase, partial [Firmicutes bacterium]|nr:1-acyl-sn-glycerol-3-phosphate acyltransferase [Bacillota bacterium]